MTARAGLDDALGRVPVFSIGSAAPYLPCTHVHADDLRVSLPQLTGALTGHGRPSGLRVPRPVAAQRVAAARPSTVPASGTATR